MTMMNTLFKNLIDQDEITIYIDDILIHSKTIEQHRKTVGNVLQILQDNNLYLKAEKCDFEQLEVEYLGMIILEGQVKMDPTKVKGIAEWPEPKNVKQVQSFTGFCNFYR